MFSSKVKDRSTIWSALDKEYKKYRASVCSQTKESRRAVFLRFKEESSVLFECVKVNAVLTEVQAEFLQDQRGPRQQTIMEYLLLAEVPNTHASPMDVDVELEEVETHEIGIGYDEPAAPEPDDESCFLSDESGCNEEEEGHLYFSLRSGKRTKALLSTESDTEADDDEKQSGIRIGPKLFSKKCVEAIIAMNVQAHITINQARLCFTLVENIFNGQSLRLHPEEKPKKVPRTAEDYKAYHDVVPSESVIWTYRHKYAVC